MNLPTPLFFAKNFPDDYVNDLFFIISAINSLITFYRVNVKPNLYVEGEAFDILLETSNIFFNIEIRRILDEKNLKEKLEKYINRKIRKIKEKNKNLYYCLYF